MRVIHEIPLPSIIIKQPASSQCADCLRIQRYHEQTVDLQASETMPLSNTWEKLHTAVLLLAIGEESIEERVRDAYTSALMRLNEAEVPEPLRDDLKVLKAQLTKFDLSGDDERVEAAACALTTDEAVAIATKIVSLYDEITRRYGAVTG